MNDASEVLGVIFECLHKAFVPNATSVGNSESSITRGSWDCYEEFPCMAHALFGLQVAEQMNCQGCHLESRHFKYTTFFHHINASALRSAKVCCSKLWGCDCSVKLLPLLNLFGGKYNTAYSILMCAKVSTKFSYYMSTTLTKLLVCFSSCCN